MTLLAIDPGNTESAYVIIDDSRRPIEFDKIGNDALLGRLRHGGPHWALAGVDAAVLEMVASYGMTVGADVFETCVWIGRFYQTLDSQGLDLSLVKRLPVKLHHCHTARATDANIAQALVDRFAPGQRNHGKGTKKEPGWFHGFRADVWQATALAVYAMDKIEAGEPL